MESYQSSRVHMRMYICLSLRFTLPRPDTLSSHRGFNHAPRNHHSAVSSSLINSIYHLPIIVRLKSMLLSSLVASPSRITPCEDHTLKGLLEEKTGNVLLIDFHILIKAYIYWRTKSFFTIQGSKDPNKESKSLGNWSF